MKKLLTHTRPEQPHHPARSDRSPADKGFVVNAPVGESELLLCHGNDCIVRGCVI